MAGVSRQNLRRNSRSIGQYLMYGQHMLTIASRLDVMNRLGRAMADPTRSRILLSLLDCYGEVFGNGCGSIWSRSRVYPVTVMLCGDPAPLPVAGLNPKEHESRDRLPTDPASDTAREVLP